MCSSERPSPRRSHGVHREPLTKTATFTGLSAFPLTPLRDDQVDEESSIGLIERLAASGADSIKIPALPADAAEAQRRVREIRDVLPEGVSIGISGDQSAVGGLLVGCDAWYSVLGGTLPELAVKLTRAALGGDPQRAREESERLAPLWELFAEFGSLRVVAAMAEQLGLAPHGCLPLPIQGLDERQSARVAEAIEDLHLTG